MRILFVSEDMMATHVAYLMKKDGHEVKLYIENKFERGCFENLVEKTNNWKRELSWVGKDGLIVFDSTGYGKIQDRLRRDGYNVFGGSEQGEKIETERAYGYEVFKQIGLNTLPLIEFYNKDDAIDFIKKNPDRWVLKFSDHASFKNLAFIAEHPTSEDLISVLEAYEQNVFTKRKRKTLQKFVPGIEVGVARYFNGHDWVGPIEYNVEHTKFFPGNIGPVVDELGTVAWYDTNESEKLYTETLARFKDILTESNFRGDFGVGCIVNENGIFPLEVTARLGSPIVHLHSELHESSWADFMMAVAKGEGFDLQYKSGYGVVTLVLAPPFPYNASDVGVTIQGIELGTEKLEEDDWHHIHFDEIAALPDDERRLVVASPDGYLLHVTGAGATIEEAREKTLAIIDKMVIPKKFYRNDIGKTFEEEQLPQLRSWGYYS